MDSNKMDSNNIDSTNNNKVIYMGDIGILIIAAITTVGVILYLAHDILIDYIVYILGFAIGLTVLYFLFKNIKINLSGLIICGILMCMIIITVVILIQSDNTKICKPSAKHKCIGEECEEETEEEEQSAPKKNNYECFSNITGIYDAKNEYRLDDNSINTKYNKMLLNGILKQTDNIKQNGSGICITDNNTFGNIFGINNNNCVYNKTFGDVRRDEDRSKNNIRNGDKAILDKNKYIKHETDEEIKRIDSHEDKMLLDDILKPKITPTPANNLLSGAPYREGSGLDKHILTNELGYNIQYEEVDVEMTNCLDKNSDFNYACFEANKNNINLNEYDYKQIGYKNLNSNRCINNKTKAVCSPDYYSKENLYKNYTDCVIQSTTEKDFKDICNEKVSYIPEEYIVAANIDAYDCNPPYVRAKCLDRRKIERKKKWLNSRWI